MGDSRRFRRWFFTAVLLVPFSLPAWTSVGNAGADMGKDCVSCHKFKPGTPGADRKDSRRVPAGVESPHRKRPSADRAKGGKGTENTMPSAPGERTPPRGNPSVKPADPTPATTIKR